MIPKRTELGRLDPEKRPAFKDAIQTTGAHLIVSIQVLTSVVLITDLTCPNLTRPNLTRPTLTRPNLTCSGFSAAMMLPLLFGFFSHVRVDLCSLYMFAL